MSSKSAFFTQTHEGPENPPQRKPRRAKADTQVLQIGST